MNQLLTPGQTAFRDWGHLHVRIDRDHEGIAITVTHHATLNRTFLNDDLPAARTYLTFLRDAALAGQPVWQIEAGALALINAGHALTHADAELVDAVNATMDEVAARPDSTRLTETAREIAGDGREWHELRRSLTPRVPTRTRVHCQDPTPAELARIRAHTNGVVTLLPGQPWTLLRAIVRRKLAHDPRTGRKYTSVRLNHRGLALAEQGSVAA